MDLLNRFTSNYLRRDREEDEDEREKPRKIQRNHYISDVNTTAPIAGNSQAMRALHERLKFESEMLHSSETTFNDIAQFPYSLGSIELAHMDRQIAMLESQYAKRIRKQNPTTQKYFPDADKLNRNTTASNLSKQLFSAPKKPRKPRKSHSKKNEKLDENFYYKK